MLASEIISKARLVLQDPDGVRWEDEELLSWLSEAQLQIARFPGVYSVTSIVDLVEGTKQRIPDDAIQLESVSHNVDPDGVPLTPVRITTRLLLDSCLPLWHQMPESPIVSCFVYDDKTPKFFDVYPPNDGTGRLEVTCLGVPPSVTKLTDKLALDDTFGTACLSWVLYRAFGKDSDYAPGVAQSSTYYQNFSNELQAEMQCRGQLSPNLTLKPGVVKDNGGTE